MDTNDSIIDWFRASTRYINAHRGKVFVILLSGEAMQDPGFSNIVSDLSLLHSLGVKLVIAHGARPQISEALTAADLPSRYHRNLRITGPESIMAVKQVITGLAASLDASFSVGIANSPLHGAEIKLVRGNFIVARPVGIHEGVDYHYTGRVRRIQTAAIAQQLAQGNLVMLSNLGYSLTGEVFNLSAEEIATEAAKGLKADKLILLVPGEGVLSDRGELQTALNEQDAIDALERLQVSAEPDHQAVSHSLAAALDAYRGGVSRCHLINFRRNGALLQELFSREGCGSLLSDDSFDQLRSATLDDVAGIINLIRPLELDGTLVSRSRERLENEIGNFKLIELEGSVIACAALYPIDSESSEVACIAIHPHYQKQQFGARLLRALEKDARTQNVKTLFVLTTVTSHWFLEQGFNESSPANLPEARQRLYNWQRNSKVLVKRLD